MKLLSVKLEDELHKQLKLLAVNEGRTVSGIITELVRKELETKKSNHAKFGDRRDCSKPETCKPRNHLVL